MQTGNSFSVVTVNTKPLGKLFVPLERARGIIPKQTSHGKRPQPPGYFLPGRSGSCILHTSGSLWTAGSWFLSKSHFWKGTSLGLVTLVLASSTQLWLSRAEDYEGWHRWQWDRPNGFQKKHVAAENQFHQAILWPYIWRCRELLAHRWPQPCWLARRNGSYLRPIFPICS